MPATSVEAAGAEDFFKFIGFLWGFFVWASDQRAIGMGCRASVIESCGSKHTVCVHPLSGNRTMTQGMSEFQRQCRFS